MAHRYLPSDPLHPDTLKEKQRWLRADFPTALTPRVAQPAQGTSIADELRKLVDLKNSGALNEAEFQAAKQRLLGTSGQQ